MFLIFGLLVWLPMLLSNPRSHLNWAGNAMNLLITGAAWIVADFCAQDHVLASSHRRPRQGDPEL